MKRGIIVEWLIAIPASVAVIGSVAYGIVASIRNYGSDQSTRGMCAAVACEVGIPTVVTYPLNSGTWRCACVTRSIP